MRRHDFSNKTCFVEGHRARRRFGQHFLSDASICEAIVKAISPREGDLLVEIGPGLGALTQRLLARVPHLYAIELDRDLACKLRSRWDPQRLALYQADALAFDFCALCQDAQAPVEVVDPSVSVRTALPAVEGASSPPFKLLRLVGNLPYNISTPLLVSLVSSVKCIEDQHFMLQKEVADRIVASAGGKTFGRLTVVLQCYYEVELLLDIPASAFSPPPKVQSAFIRMTPLPLPRVESFVNLGQLLEVAFSQRRKMLRRCLIPWLEIQGVFWADLLDPSARPENVSVGVWATLAGRLASLP